MASPVKFKDAATRSEFANWLHSELFNAIGDRDTLERQWANFIEQYDAPRRGPGEFPFPGASNEEMPLTAMHAEPVIAQFMQSLHAPKNIWTAVDLSGEFTDDVNAITEYLTILDRLYLHMREVDQRAFPDLVILGTCVYHPTWLFQRKKVRTYDETGNVISDIQVIDQPSTRHIPLSDFIWPANAWDIDPDAVVAPARWVGHRFKVTRNQLAAMAKGQEPFAPNYDKEAVRLVLEREQQDERAVEEKVRDTDQLRPSQDLKIELFRIEARYDVDGDGIDEDVVVIWHQGTRTILQVVHNFWHHNKRLYEVQQYIRTFSLLGKGIAAMNEYAQATASRLLNAQVDNALLANTRMYGIPEGMAFQPGEPVYPGKTWPLRSGEQIQEVKLSDIYPSTFALLGQLQEWAEQRTSVNELRTGNISGLPSRTPATTVLSLMQEGNKKFDMILSNLRTGAIANIGKRTLQMVAQRHQSGSRKWADLAMRMMGDDAQRVITILDLPQTVMEEGLGIEVTSTSGQVNKEVEKQNLIGLGQFYGQAGAQLLQLTQMTGDQQMMAQTAMGLYNGGLELMRRILEAFDIQNPERYLPQNPQQQQPAGMPMQPAGGMGGGPLGPAQLGALLGLG